MANKIKIKRALTFYAPTGVLRRLAGKAAATGLAGPAPVLPLASPKPTTDRMVQTIIVIK